MHPLLWFLIGILGIPLALVAVFVIGIFIWLFPAITLGLILVWIGGFGDPVKIMSLAAGLNILYLILAIASAAGRNKM